MASSMLTAEVSTLASTEADVDAAMKTVLHTCANDPDFAVVCDFLQKFSKDLDIELPNFKLLLLWLTKTDEGKYPIVLKYINFSTNTYFYPCS